MHSVCAQYYFNRMHPVSCQDDPGYYRADGWYGEVALMDPIGIYQDGYLAIGAGILEDPNNISNHNYNHAFVSKLSLEGDHLWTKRFDNEQDTLSNFFSRAATSNLLRNNDGTITLIGEEYNNSSSNLFSRLHLLVFNFLGDTIERHFIQESRSTISVFQIIEDLEDSTYVWAGISNDSTVATGVGGMGILMKVGLDGHKFWERKFPEIYSVHNISKLASNRYFVSGTTFPGSNSLCSDNWTWNQDYIYGIYNSDTDEFNYNINGGACGLDIAYPLVQDSLNVILFGFNSATIEGDGCSMSNGNFYTQKLERNEDVLIPEEMANFGFMCRRHTIKIGKKTHTNSFVLAGDCYQFTPTNSRGFLYKINSDLDSAWFRTYYYYANGGEQIVHKIYNFSETQDGGFVCAGSVKQDLSGPNPLLESPWIFKVDSYGCLEPGCQYVGVSEMVIGLQDAMRVYPNPVVDLLTVGFSLPAGFSLDEDTQLVLTDMQGRTLLSENIQQRGWENFRHIINVQDLAAGTYVLHWKSDTKWLDSATVVKN
jgi:hypothetical protein